jgi:NadR type nicotinamide-nucleotide adenylyltransferase
MSDKPIKIVITGAESTGKSTLTEALATHFQTKWIPEFSRSYVEKLNRSYTYSDIEKIARHQITEEQNIDPDISLVFFDTWLIITKVWFEFVFGECPVWLNESILQSKIDLFLVCDIDIPWIPDSVRENGGENRRILHNIYINQIKSYGFNYQIISGIGEERTIRALNIVDEFLGKVNLGKLFFK